MNDTSRRLIALIGDLGDQVSVDGWTDVPTDDDARLLHEVVARTDFLLATVVPFHQWPSRDDPKQAELYWHILDKLKKLRDEGRRRMAVERCVYGEGKIVVEV